jgi:hypothetical protein
VPISASAGVAVALRAGRYQAAMSAAKTKNNAAQNVPGSRSETPQSWLARNFESHRLPSVPNQVPKMMSAMSQTQQSLTRLERVSGGGAGWSRNPCSVSMGPLIERKLDCPSSARPQLVFTVRFRTCEHHRIRRLSGRAIFCPQLRHTNTYMVRTGNVNDLCVRRGEKYAQTWFCA